MKKRERLIREADQRGWSRQSPLLQQFNLHQTIGKEKCTLVQKRSISRHRLWKVFLFMFFLDASTHLHKRVCPSLGPSVGPSRVFFYRGIQAKKWSNFQQCPCPMYVTNAVVYTSWFLLRDMSLNFQILASACFSYFWSLFHEAK